MTRLTTFALAAMISMPAAAQEVSVEEGLRISIIGGCHDCHTAGFAQMNGELDPETALTGNPVGYQGPWGTTYAANLRLTFDGMDEDDFVGYMKNLQSRPPMPWFNVHEMTENELRSLYRYVDAFEDLGEPAPEFVPPGETPLTPYVVMTPVMP